MPDLILHPQLIMLNLNEMRVGLQLLCSKQLFLFLLAQLVCMTSLVLISCLCLGHYLGLLWGGD